MAELTGIQRGTGAKVKADIQGSEVVFRGAIKQTVAFADLGAEARGTLLSLTFGSHTVDLAAGAKAGTLAAKIRRG